MIMELLYAFLLCLVSFVLIYQWGDYCIQKRRRTYSIAVVLAVVNCLIAGIHIANFLGK